MSNDDRLVSRSRVVVWIIERIGIGGVLAVASFAFLVLTVDAKLKAIQSDNAAIKLSMQSQTDAVKQIAIQIEVNGRLQLAESKAQTKLAVIQCVNMTNSVEVRRECIAAFADR